MMRFGIHEFDKVSETSQRALPAHMTDRLGRGSQANTLVVAWHVIDCCRLSLNYIAILVAVVISRRSLAMIMLLFVRADHDVVVTFVKNNKGCSGGVFRREALDHPGGRVAVEYWAS